MKVFKIITFISLLLSSSLSLADDNTTASILIDPEFSVVLLSPQYAQLVAEQTTAATQQGESLSISTLTKRIYGKDEIYVYIDLVARASSDFQADYKPKGQIVATLLYSPLGDLLIDAIYFKPSDESPGGASVGN